ncbi:efflux transporter outer membrane subunit [Pseudoroseomonas cervicalis]|uniref:efflux transporter outer membrane subunit n=1 Tax=Teichococcus cervicalis TaxID=204525 RepID=UPI0027832D61|nr:efflux transporter outer membrane subunit [Pseudoroseomonas cervicalis]MDQ1079651.1 multidrug efflux system outer membrane protein [Pseudoroseomonas cervicalis]
MIGAPPRHASPRPALPALLLLAPLLLAACAGGSTPPAAGIPLAGSFRHAAAAEPVRWPEPDWWRGFNAPELDRLMALAMAGNLDLAQAEARIRQADASLRIAGAALLPSIDADVSASRQRSSGGGRAVTRNSYGATLSASYEVDLWGGNAASRRSAEQSLRAARYNAGAIGISTTASLANTYFALLADRERLRVQSENVDAARRVLAVIRSQVQAGTATGLDLAQQETVVAQQEAQLPSLRQAIDQGVNAIALLIGQPPEQVLVAGSGLEGLRVPPAAPGQPAELLARRPDVLQAEANLAAAQANIDVARAALLPSLTLSAQGGVSGAVLGTLLRPEQQVWSLAAGLAQSVFDGGARRGQVELSQAQAEELLGAYRYAILDALRDVEDALVALRETTAQEEAYAEAASRAARAAQIAEAQLRLGTINLITLLNTQQTLFSARNALVEARLSRLQAATGLFRALGGGWR